MKFVIYSGFNNTMKVRRVNLECATLRTHHFETAQQAQRLHSHSCLNTFVHSCRSHCQTEQSPCLNHGIHMLFEYVFTYKS